VIKTICAVSILTADLLFASQPVKAAWLCGPEQCVWVHHHVAVVPAFAATWAPPSIPGASGAVASLAAGGLSVPRFGKPHQQTRYPSGAWGACSCAVRR